MEIYTIQTSKDGVHWTDYDDNGHPKVSDNGGQEMLSCCCCCGFFFCFVCVCVCVCVKQINSRFDLSFYCYLVSYNTTGVLHSSDKMTECELTLAG